MLRHVETVNFLLTDSFNSCLRRLISLRGPIRQLMSDCSTNFFGAENELNTNRKYLNNSRIYQFLRSQICDYFTFKMNVPAVSHIGANGKDN